jgi:rRNA maturation endonuclease Nob1
MDIIRRCLGCQATYPADEHACPKCGSHAADVEQAATEKRKAPESGRPKPTRKT